MNLGKLKENFGMVVKLVPRPQRDRVGGSLLADQYNQWMLLPGNSDGIQFKNTITDHVIELKSDNIREFRTPDFVILRGQMILQDENSIRFEPFAPIPADQDFASLFVGQAHLQLLINGKDALLCFLGGGPLNARELTFEVKNTGDRHTKDFYVTVLIPQKFRTPDLYRPSSFPHIGTRTIDTMSYTSYKNFIDKPVYPNSLLNIGSLILFAPLSQHSILWEIDSADGKFPPGGQLGNIMLRFETETSP